VSYVRGDGRRVLHAENAYGPVGSGECGACATRWDMVCMLLLQSATLPCMMP